MRKERKHYTGEEKVAILRRHLLDKVPVSDLCDELGLQPTVFYRWQKEFFENAALQPSLSGYTQSELDKVALRLNQRPRKTLGFQTPRVSFEPVLRRPIKTTALIGHRHLRRGSPHRHEVQFH